MIKSSLLLASRRINPSCWSSSRSVPPQLLSSSYSNVKTAPKITSFAFDPTPTYVQAQSHRKFSTSPAPSPIIPSSTSPTSFLPSPTSIPLFDDSFSRTLPFGVLWKCYTVQQEYSTLSKNSIKISMSPELSSSSEGVKEISRIQKRMSRLLPMYEIFKSYQAFEIEKESIRDLLAEPDTVEDEELFNEFTAELVTLDNGMLSCRSVVIEETLKFYSREVQAAIAKAETEALADKAAASAEDTDIEPESTNVILEIRPGTGGDEASLFALELLQNYEKTAIANSWSWDVLSLVRTELGGLKEGVIGISDGGFSEVGSGGVYAKLRYESGVHRVQRVPINDVKIQTSAATVVVLPQAQAEKDVQLLPMSELRIDVYRASGAGGQHVNTTESAVRVTHLPTGLVAAIQDERSQHKNKDKALKLIAARVFDLRRQESEKKSAEVRSAVMGSGSRSDRIRTYNFKDDRVTDHRSKITVFGCNKILEFGTVVETFFEGLESLSRDDILMEMDEKGKEEWSNATAVEEEGGGAKGKKKKKN